jgi:four helix bundle protein
MNMEVFESLRVGQDARRLTLEIYRITLSGDFGIDRALRDQLRRASITVMSNIAEVSERGGAREFLHFLRIAKGSAGEVRSQLYAAEDLGYLARTEAVALRHQAAVISRRIRSLGRYRMEKQ